MLQACFGVVLDLEMGDVLGLYLLWGCLQVLGGSLGSLALGGPWRFLEVLGCPLRILGDPMGYEILGNLRAF